MNVSLDPKAQKFVDGLVAEGRYPSATEVVTEGLRLVAEREARLTALRSSVEAAIARGGDFSDDNVALALQAAADRQKARGIGA